jgi:hypothetical protein
MAAIFTSAPLCEQQIHEGRRDLPESLHEYLESAALATYSERSELPSLKPMNPDLVPGTKP